MLRLKHGLQFASAACLALTLSSCAGSGSSVNPVQSFTLSSSPNNVGVVQGSNGTSTVTVNPANGFSGSVTLSASGLPSGVTASFAPNPTTTTSTLTFT
ncbi:MAG: hypothetical protein WCC46_15305, partial [Terriglobales bacterium]